MSSNIQQSAICLIKNCVRPRKSMGVLCDICHCTMNKQLRIEIHFAYTYDWAKKCYACKEEAPPTDGTKLHWLLIEAGLVKS